MRPWSREVADFADTDTVVDLDGPAVAGPQDTAADDYEWCLPLVFHGRFDPEEEDFEGDTFFDHPAPDPDRGDVVALGKGRRRLFRHDKRACGFLYLRANRTGSRALSFQRGSLLDTIVRLEAEKTGQLWEQALRTVEAVTVASEESGFSQVRTSVRDRVARFLALVDGPEPLDVQVSDLTREHLRDVLRLTVSTQPGTHGVPFNRLSTGTLNQLVFALLTYIAELQGHQSVIFAMEEPEIALPPHAQRRLVDFATTNMGQTIVTSHSPYVIERFEPQQIVALSRDDTGGLQGAGVRLPAGFKPKRYHQNSRQFAEAVLARAVLVVEGATETIVFRALAETLEKDPPPGGYDHPDLAGLSLFDAGNDVSVPEFASIFAAMGKLVFGIHDTPNKPLSPELQTKAAAFDLHEQIPYSGIEALLSTETPLEAQRDFASAILDRADYPAKCGYLADDADDAAVRSHTFQVLRATKGPGTYGGLLIAECVGRAQLPATLTAFLLEVHAHIKPVHQQNPVEPDEGEPDGEAEPDGA
jgi:putative ATP-dependent endonuclease of OLD family